jgi:hypothetical protein
MDLLFLKIHGAFFAGLARKKPGYPLQFLKNYLEVIFCGISAPIPCAEPTVFLRFAQFDFL